MFRKIFTINDLLSGTNLSIRLKILLALGIVVFMMIAVNAILIVRVLQYNRQYDAIIINITTANSINGHIKPAIDTEMWNIVAGKIDFEQGKQYEIIDNTNKQLQWMIQNTDSSDSKIRLEILLRTMKTLTYYVNLMGEQIKHDSKVAENQRVLENIHGVSDLINDLVQEYMLFEVNQAGQQYEEMQQSFIQWAFIYIVLMVGTIVFSIFAAIAISRSIYIPIKKLHDVTTTITKNDLQALVTHGNVDEITELGISFNIMIGRIRELLDAKIREQENLKKAELRTLQAQINPHFLYNTLDTIVWMAELKKTEQVVEIVKALSNFFRTTLSKGKDWITIGEEIELTKNYLTIQKMRYQDILNYKIEVDEAVVDEKILKLTLQPLVENALYHGIKPKRGGGTITVRAKQNHDHQVLLEVEDDGVGCTPYRLGKIQQEINSENDEIILKESGFGLANVSKRIKLYYGKQYGLSINSQYQGGTQITVAIPAK
jgi:two-component system, sensor histidine kinase YesM